MNIHMKWIKDILIIDLHFFTRNQNLKSYHIYPLFINYIYYPSSKCINIRIKEQLIKIIYYKYIHLSLQQDGLNGIHNQRDTVDGWVLLFHQPINSILLSNHDICVITAKGNAIFPRNTQFLEEFIDQVENILTCNHM